MIQFLVGFAVGNAVGMYIAQNYEVPDVGKKVEEWKKALNSKRKNGDDK